MIKYLSVLFLTVFLSCNKNTDYAKLSEKSYVILKSREHGMFSILDDVLSLINAKKTNLIAGFEVDFGDSGLYYDPKHGSNWFSYYFEPVKLGNKTDEIIESAEMPYSFWPKVKERNMYSIPHIEFSSIDKNIIEQMMNDYIKIKPQINNEINDYINKNFNNNHIIGIHYRGTDKSSEAPRTPYEKVKEAVEKHVKDKGLTVYKIFIATDEQEFIDYMKKHFQNIIHQDALRSKSGNAVHFDNDDPYRAGKEALMDCLLLSKTNYLIRTSSNLSRWSMYFNPKLEVLELSQRL